MKSATKVGYDGEGEKPWAVFEDEHEDESGFEIRLHAWLTGEG
ncbi:hypothetical protein [Pediococcus acidilactici]|nr:hypothetical protein [Pediococcus acidilactici]